MTLDQISSQAKVVVAQRIKQDLQLNAGHPSPEWRKATPVVFTNDWRGLNPEPDRETEVRLLWNAHYLYLRFQCRYRAIYVFSDSSPNGRRDHLWDRDVAEAFLQPDASHARFYKEFEVSPNGMWIDLDIFPGGLADLKSGLQRSVVLDERKHVWVAELAVPLRALTKKFDPEARWRTNFYRVEGSREPRSYLAWSPTRTPEPNFHVPQAFGVLKFQK